MRLSVDHRTVYRFSTPQARLVQLLRLTPANTHDQTVASWRIHVDCDAHMRDGRDGFGNHVTMLYADGSIEAISIAVQGEVLTSHSDGVLHGASEPLPPLVFCRFTPATPADPTIADFARYAAASARDPLDGLHRLNAELHDRFPVAPRAGDPHRTAAEAFVRGEASPRDLAQMFVVAARALGQPARYVSGYRLMGAEEHRSTPHGWAEAHVDDIGWIGFDPSTGLSPQEDYVRVAAALDAPGAAPVAGLRFGEGREELDVDLIVREE
jgi:transglutaminase-like putative cysteine protease